MRLSDIKSGTAPKHIADVIGNKFGLLTIIEYVGSHENRYYVNAMCECGEIKIFNASNIIWGTTVSCSCHKNNYRKKKAA